MDVSQYCSGESQYLKAEDLPENGRVPLIIDEAVEEAVKDRKKDRDSTKLILYFDPSRRIPDKGLCLNVTNTKLLAETYGAESELWKGKPVILYRTRTQFGADIVPCLRLEIPAEQSAEQPTPPAEKATYSEPAPTETVAGPVEDEIPF